MNTADWETARVSMSACSRLSEGPPRSATGREEKSQRKKTNGKHAREELGLKPVGFDSSFRIHYYAPIVPCNVKGA